MTKGKGNDRRRPKKTSRAELIGMAIGSGGVALFLLILAGLME